jgi:hypothetical protein
MVCAYSTFCLAPRQVTNGLLLGSRWYVDRFGKLPCCRRHVRLVDGSLISATPALASAQADTNYSANLQSLFDAIGFGVENRLSVDDQLPGGRAMSCATN